MGIYLNPSNDLFAHALNSEIYIDKPMLIKLTNKRINSTASKGTPANCKTLICWYDNQYIYSSFCFKNLFIRGAWIVCYGFNLNDKYRNMSNLCLVFIWSLKLHQDIKWHSIVQLRNNAQTPILRASQKDFKKLWKCLYRLKEIIYHSLTCTFCGKYFLYTFRLIVVWFIWTFKPYQKH